LGLRSSIRSPDVRNADADLLVDDLAVEVQIHPAVFDWPALSGQIQVVVRDIAVRGTRRRNLYRLSSRSLRSLS
jgi:hypothetical protein